LISLGGATEASIWSVLHDVRDSDAELPSIPYGRAMRNQQLHVLDANMRPRPVWVSGDLYIGGYGLARGYYRDEQKTNAAFIRHPATGERLYRTGDLGRFLPNGEIEFLGRDDTQVKIQGYRIELGEVETALLAHASVRAAGVVAEGTRAGAKQLVAYVVPQGEPPREQELLSMLRTRLPDYAVPRALVFLEALPLSSNGKVDRKALAELRKARAKAVEQPAELSASEQRLAGIFREVLEVPAVAADDDFFELGGNSLLAVRLLTQIRAHYGRELPLASLFEYRTVRAFAQLLEDRAAPAPRKTLVAVRSTGRSSPFFCVHPVSGNVVCYAQLARSLDASIPFYALQAAEPTGDAAVRIEDLARDYLAAIRTVQARGPYRLGGWSMGGVVAYEIAQQLRAGGEEVAVLALLDVRQPPMPTQANIDDRALLRWFTRDLIALSGAAVACEDRDLGGLECVQHAKLFLARAGALPDGVSDRDVDGWFRLFRQNMQALIAYRASSYDGHLTFVRGTKEGGASAELMRSWQRLAKSATGSEVEADHYSLFREHVGALASALSGVLLSVESAPLRGVQA
jgi:thioesterase domain-containing protein/acyl carrier protein